MKKFFVTILAVLYMAVSTGATVNLHYCMGKLMSWDLYPQSQGKCDACNMEKSGHKGCCHDEQKQVKIEKDQKVAESTVSFSPISLQAVVVDHVDFPFTYVSSIVAHLPTAHAPPRLGRTPIYVLHCNFRI